MLSKVVSGRGETRQTEKTSKEEGRDRDLRRTRQVLIIPNILGGGSDLPGKETTDSA